MLSEAFLGQHLAQPAASPQQAAHLAGSLQHAPEQEAVVACGLLQDLQCVVEQPVDINIPAAQAAANKVSFII